MPTDPSHAEENPAEATAEFQPSPFRLGFAAASDIGASRKDNQDSGYAGPWLLAVCDGVGGAARGDLASATVIDELRLLDHRPTGDPLVEVRSSLNRAHDQIGRLIDAEPALSGTSTTAVVALFSGERLTFGHVGDSRAYLLRGQRIEQLTRDHTLVQTMIDDGQISEEDARTHPNRNLILKAIDGVHDADPDIFALDLAVGDRLLLCSDGASGSLTDDEMAHILAAGDAHLAAGALIEASLKAGSSDNITCVVADVISAQDPKPSAPILVGAAAIDPREPGQLRSAKRSRHADDISRRALTEAASTEREGSVALDTAPTPPTDLESVRYAPRPPRRFQILRRLLVCVIGIGIAWIGGAAAWSWTQDQYYVGESDGRVTIFRGVNAEVPLLDLSSEYETSDVATERLSNFQAREVRGGMPEASLADARRTVDGLAAEQVP